MTVAAQDPINQFTIVGGETSGPWTWQLNADADLTVFKQLASTGEILTLTLDTDFSVNPAGLGSKLGGTINFLAPQLPAGVGDVWTLQRDTVLKRSKDFATSGDFLAVTVNPQMDDPILMNQDSTRDAQNALRKNPGIADELNPLIPQPVSGRALKLAESEPGKFVIVMSETDPDDGSVRTVAGMFATVLNTPSNIVVQESQDGFEIRVNTSGGDIDITLPDSTSLSADFRVAITKSSADANKINVKVQGTDTVNGVTSDTVQGTQFLRLLYVLDQSTGAYIFAIDQVGIQSVVQDTSPQYGAAMDTNGFSTIESQGAAVTSDPKPNIWAGDGDTHHIIGTTQIDDFTDAPRVGAKVTLIFDGVLTLKTGLGITLSGGQDIITQVGDRFEVYADALDAFSGIYTRANGQFIILRPEQAATGSAINFPNIPAGTKRIDMMFHNVLLTASAVDIIVQIGDSGGIETAGYTESSSRIINGGNPEVAANTDGFHINRAADGDSFAGIMTLLLMNQSTNKWVSSYAGRVNATAVGTGGGVKLLSAELDAVRVIPFSSTFSSGFISIQFSQ